MTKARKQNFSSFNKRRAFETLELRDLQPWNPEIVPIQPSDFFRIRCQRLDQFDLESYEESGTSKNADLGSYRHGRIRFVAGDEAARHN